ncbi:MAG: hypothetical protein C0596_17275 [Marinilabiliales bacterium]|nr:MAG: hypothetical protein C0596_17275 [Marinilabiliales bacterium]
MKTIATISIILLSITGVFAINDQNPEVKKNPKAQQNSEIEINRANLILPWADNSPVEMEKVYTKDNYVLWKCKSENVNQFPGYKIKGTVFNYFIYKNGKFHMTVTEMNKTSVYNFFTS